MHDTTTSVTSRRRCLGGDEGHGGDGESTAPVVEAEPSVYVAADRGILRGAGA